MTTDSDIYLSRRTFDVNRKPFPHFEIPNYLDDALYRELADSFPRHELFRYEREGGNLLITDDVADRFVADHPAWQNLFDRLSDRAFIRDTLHSIGRLTFLGARGPVAILPMIPPIGGPGFGGCVDFNFKFSRMGPGTHFEVVPVIWTGWRPD